MSIEQVLLFLLVIAVPLLERLVRAMRTRSAGAPAERTPVPVPELPPPAPSLPVPAATVPPALPEAVRRPPTGPDRPSERERRLRERRPGPAPSIRGRQADRPRAARVLAGGDLRRAMVLIAVLGPCRALERQDASQPG